MPLYLFKQTVRYLVQKRILERVQDSNYFTVAFSTAGIISMASEYQPQKILVPDLLIFYHTLSEIIRSIVLHEYKGFAAIA